MAQRSFLLHSTNIQETGGNPQTITEHHNVQKFHRENFLGSTWRQPYEGKGLAVRAAGGQSNREHSKCDSATATVLQKHEWWIKVLSSYLWTFVVLAAKIWKLLCFLLRPPAKALVQYQTVHYYAPKVLSPLSSHLLRWYKYQKLHVFVLIILLCLFLITVQC